MRPATFGNARRTYLGPCDACVHSISHGGNGLRLGGNGDGRRVGDGYCRLGCDGDGWHVGGDGGHPDLARTCAPLATWRRRTSAPEPVGRRAPSARRRSPRSRSRRGAPLSRARRRRREHGRPRRPRRPDLALTCTPLATRRRQSPQADAHRQRVGGALALDRGAALLCRAHDAGVASTPPLSASAPGCCSDLHSTRHVQRRRTSAHSPAAPTLISPRLPCAQRRADRVRRCQCRHARRLCVNRRMALACRVTRGRGRRVGGWDVHARAGEAGLARSERATVVWHNGQELRQARAHPSLQISSAAAGPLHWSRRITSAPGSTWQLLRGGACCCCIVRSQCANARARGRVRVRRRVRPRTSR